MADPLANRREGVWCVAVDVGRNGAGLLLAVDQHIGQRLQGMDISQTAVLQALQGLCQQLLGKILGKAPLAVGMVLECVNAHYAKDADGYAAEVKAFGQAFESHDFKEGTTAFVEKRAAVFTGK